MPLDKKPQDSIDIPLGQSDFFRAAAELPHLNVYNRYFEPNQFSSAGGSFISRPGLAKRVAVGSGPIRAMYTQPGAFNDELFVISGSTLYRVTTAGSASAIKTFTLPGGYSDTPKMIATNKTSIAGELLYISINGELWVYGTEVSLPYAANILQATGSIAENDVVVIDGVYYKFVTNVDGVTDGSSGNPHLVKLSGLTGLGGFFRNWYSFMNLVAAINDDYYLGTYSVGVTAHPTVQAYQWGGIFGGMRVVARTAGAGGNSITCSETSSAMAWQSATLTGGDDNDAIQQVPLPDGTECGQIGFISSYAIIAVSNDSDLAGRFYWIKPGEWQIDALDFATAERAPDGINDIKTIGDTLWFFGPNSTEVWYPTADLDLPFKRVQGRLFDRGVWGNTAVSLKDSVFFADRTGMVYQMEGSPRRISDHSVEERVRRAIADGEDVQNLKGWGFDIDGHTFYVLNLGTQGTLVYDMASGRWAQWSTEGEDLWRLTCGLNWQDSPIGGDNTNGQLWDIDPSIGYDEDPTDASPTAFTRTLVGGVPQKARSSTRCGGVYLSGNVGNTQLAGSTITLRVSDDAGVTWVSCGDITPTTDSYEEFAWRSLGLIKAPGRLFEVSDDGATVRIDSLEMR